MDSTSLQAVVGANCRKIRTEHGVTQAQLASHARRVGLRWTASKVGDFESGRNAVSFAAVLALVLALDNAIGARGPGPLTTWHTGGMTQRERPRVTLADLVGSDGYVTLNDDFAPTGQALAAVASGEPWELYGGDDAATAGRTDELLSPAPGVLGERYRMRLGDVEDMRLRSTLTDTRLARRLDRQTRTRSAGTDHRTTSRTLEGTNPWRQLRNTRTHPAQRVTWCATASRMARRPSGADSAKDAMPRRTRPRSRCPS